MNHVIRTDHIFCWITSSTTDL